MYTKNTVVYHTHLYYSNTTWNVGTDYIVTNTNSATLTMTGTSHKANETIRLQYGNAYSAYANNDINQPNKEPVYPTYPEPDNPSVNPPESSPINNTTNNITNNTTTADLQPILDALITINSNIDEFEDIFVRFGNWVMDALGRIIEAINSWNSQILAELRTANGWLRGIYYKRDTSPSAPDPSIDPDGYGDWWGDLIGKLLKLLPDGVTDFVDLLNQLKGVFPFSIPWDVSAILGLLAHDPVTPVFDLPLPTVTADGVATVPIHIDCTPWNDLAALVRRCVFIWFAFSLALWTREGLRNLEVD